MIQKQRSEDTLLPALTRRKLLTCAATAAVAPALPPLLAPPKAAARKSWLQRGSYAGHVGEQFQAVVEGGRTISLRLAAVRDLVGTTPGGKPLAGRDDAFLLELHGPGASPLGQGVGEFRHAAFGRQRFFFVPEAAAGRYAVVVNRSTA